MAVELEHEIKVLPIDENLSAEVKRLESEGWEMVPGTTPVAIYHLIRRKANPASAQAALGSIRVDDAKVQILRDGKLLDS